MRAYLIDPERRRLSEIELPDNDTLGAEMHRIIGTADLDYQTLSDMRDTIWVDGGGLKRGQPIHAFLIRPVQKDPYAGKAIIIGADDEGRTRAPTRSIWRALHTDIEWLGLIIPSVVWDKTEKRARTIVTYARADRPPPAQRSKWERSGEHFAKEGE